MSEPKKKMTKAAKQLVVAGIVAVVLLAAAIVGSQLIDSPSSSSAGSQPDKSSPTLVVKSGFVSCDALPADKVYEYLGVRTFITEGELTIPSKADACYRHIGTGETGVERTVKVVYNCQLDTDYAAPGNPASQLWDAFKQAGKPLDYGDRLGVPDARYYIDEGSDPVRIHVGVLSEKTHDCLVEVSAPQELPINGSTPEKTLSGLKKALEQVYTSTLPGVPVAQN